MNFNVYNMKKKLQAAVAEMLKHISCMLPQIGPNEHNILQRGHANHTEVN